MTAPGRVGVIADSTLQGHLLSSAVKSQGYQVVVNTDPEALEKRWLEEGALDLWVVDLSSEDRWQAFLDNLLEDAAGVTRFTGEGDAALSFLGSGQSVAATGVIPVPIAVCQRWPAANSGAATLPELTRFSLKNQQA